jgi:aspartyl/glutamyl-tRNA(Asn/Gln) amidotransferase C subunit
MSISLDEVAHVARLARLQLDEHELIAFQGELNALLGHFEDIRAIDVDGMRHRHHAAPLRNVWEDDEPRPGLAREDVLRMAPVTRGGLFVVPTIIED